MCLVLLAVDRCPGWPLVLAANREEWHARPASALDWWHDRPHVVGGRDAVAGGTWLGAHRDGRFATVLNDARVAAPPGAPSRGGLVTAFLDAPDAAAAVSALHARRGDYAGFHLVMGWPGAGWYCGSRSERPRALGPGIHAVGNDGPDPDAPRLQRARRRLQAELSAGAGVDELLQLLADPADPGPGAGDARPVFVTHPEFGTRSSTIYRVADDGSAILHERRFDASGRVLGDRACEWRIAPARSGD